MWELCEKLSEIDLLFWQTVIIDWEMYVELNILTFDSFKERVCSLEMIDDYFGRQKG